MSKLVIACNGTLHDIFMPKKHSDSVTAVEEIPLTYSGRNAPGGPTTNITEHAKRYLTTVLRTKREKRTR